jgi:uncharacterized protein (UPF0335 family)
MSADTKLKAYIDRVLHSREREDAEKANTKQIYAELAGEGYDKTIVGKVVNHLRKDQDKVREQSELFDTYLAAYFGASHVHTRVREAKAAGADTETGEIPETGNTVSTKPAGNGASGAEEETQVATVRASSSANSSTDAGKPVDEKHSGPTNAARVRHDRQPDESQVGRPQSATLQSETSIRASTSGADTTSVDACSKPAEGNTPTSAGHGDRGAVVPSVAPVVADRSKPNPACQDPDDCGVEASWNHLCGSCLRRRAQTEAARAVQ